MSFIDSNQFSPIASVSGEDNEDFSLEEKEANRVFDQEE